MFRAITTFEVKYHLKGAVFWILALVYFLLTFFAIASDTVKIGGSIGNVHRNAPFVIMQILLIMSVFGVLTTTAFTATSIHRDFELGTDSLFFSSPLRKWKYLGGRFLGSMIVAVLVYVAVVLAIMIGSLMPWIDPEQLGPFELWPYVFSLVALIIPNLLLCGAIFFSVAAMTRSMMATWAAVIAFFAGYFISAALLQDIENQSFAGLFDPFGLNAFGVATRYWTVFDKNTRVVPFEGVYLWNRVLWIGIALAILAFTFWKFRMTTGTRRSRKKSVAAGFSPPETFGGLKPAAPLALPRAAQTFGGGASWRQFRAAVGLECGAVFTSIPFMIMLVLGVFNTWAGTSGAVFFGTPSYPVTREMIEVIQGNFSIFVLLIAAFFAGDLVWRERNLKIDEVRDAMPAPTSVLWSAKLTAILLVVLATLLAAVATTLVVQTARGYHTYEPLLYVKGALGQVGAQLVLLAMFAFIVQILFNQKFVGFLGVMLWFILSNALPALDFEHVLYRFADTPPFDYSDMNGYGHFVAPIFWTNLYWALFCAMFLIIGHLLWVRGTEVGLRSRLQIARQRFRGALPVMLVALLAGLVSTGCYIYYNTNVLNRYHTAKDREKLQAEAEKKYKRYQRIPQPRIVDVKADVDIHPERRAVYVRGSYLTVNKSGVPIRELHVTHDASSLTSWKTEIPGARLRSDDREIGYAIWTLDTPLAPGATLPVRFTTSFEAKGFVNGRSNTNVVGNGTFINNFSYFPVIGYQERFELQDRNERKKYGLRPIERLKKPDDMKARMENQLAAGTDWLSLDTTVSTSLDQTAIAPGYLQRTWTANGRRFFHYKTTSPILGFWSYLSARYQVKRGEWKGIPIEVYYDPKHPYNVDRMIHGVKRSLDYFTANFSPYQHRQVRILEFPRYERFAQAFPNTIPYSESIGFIADLRDKEEIDFVFYVTAHEIAHQWWAHQVIGGNVQGTSMITETMAQYSALMVMEKEYGRAKMQKFLRHELDRYLRERGSELIAEMPLMLVEHQGYIHYRKGSLVMYALRDSIGEERVNRALAKFIRDQAYKGPPYTTATELVRYFRAEAGPQHQELITDLFERITLYDFETREAAATKRADGKYVVKLTVASKKLRADAKGEEKEVPLDQMIDVGVLAKDDKVLFLEKRRITQPVQTFEIVVAEKPERAGIDPLNKLIDRNPKDNTFGVRRR